MTDTIDSGALGGSLEDMLTETGQREEVYGEAIKRVLAFQIDAARKTRAMSKSALAETVGTSRTQIDRVLDPENVSVSLETLERAARAVGKTLRIELVDI
ncbi:helix-turn-helix domain-containing protein [Oryzibacter oryziterrae]|uniref:helix-turn-helix domain-containing protein n=1 Tax=Oryzibacter oryziterrae TaxID=2766474 RepID=UPI001F1C9972|nr:helix-turn-helix domain-containing protein [Oryzibacter oryziterrae]